MGHEIKTQWTEPLGIELVRLGVKCHIPRPERRQIIAYQALDDSTLPAGRKRDPAEMDQLRADALRILCEGSDVPLDRLTADEEVEILWAIIALHHGYNPIRAIEAHRLLIDDTRVVLDAAIAHAAEASSLPKWLK